MATYPYGLTVVNPGAEEGDATGWTVLSVSSASPGDTGGPRTGSWLFTHPQSSSSTGTQDVSLPAELEEDVDAGAVMLDFAAWQGGWSGDSDAGRLGLRFYDGDEVEIAWAHQDEYQTVNSGWEERVLRTLVPAGTRTIRLELIARRVSGTNNDVYWDDISLVARKVETHELTLTNPGAEDGTTGWTNVTGTLASVTSGAGNSPHSGSRLFRAGASGSTHARQDVSVPEALESVVDEGDWWIRPAGFHSGWSGDSDRGYLRLEFLDGAGDPIGAAQDLPNISNQPPWRLRQGWFDLPAGTRTIRFSQLGNRVSGSNLDSYWDDLTLHMVRVLSAPPADNLRLTAAGLQVVHGADLSPAPLRLTAAGLQLVHAADTRPAPLRLTAAGLQLVLPPPPAAPPTLQVTVSGETVELSLADDLPAFFGEHVSTEWRMTRDEDEEFTDDPLLFSLESETQLQSTIVPTPEPGTYRAQARRTAYPTGTSDWSAPVVFEYAAPPIVRGDTPTLYVRAVDEFYLELEWSPFTHPEGQTTAAEFDPDNPLPFPLGAEVEIKTGTDDWTTLQFAEFITTGVTVVVTGIDFSVARTARARWLDGRDSIFTLWSPERTIEHPQAPDPSTPSGGGGSCPPTPFCPDPEITNSYCEPTERRAGLAVSPSRAWYAVSGGGNNFKSGYIDCPGTRPLYLDHLEPGRGYVLSGWPLQESDCYDCGAGQRLSGPHAGAGDGCWSTTAAEQISCTAPPWIPQPFFRGATVPGMAFSNDFTIRWGYGPVHNGDSELNQELYETDLAISADGGDTWEPLPGEEAAEYEFAVDTSEFAPGAYIVRVTGLGAGVQGWPAFFPFRFGATNERGNANDVRVKDFKSMESLPADAVRMWADSFYEFAHVEGEGIRARPSASAVLPRPEFMGFEDLGEPLEFDATLSFSRHPGATELLGVANRFGLAGFMQAGMGLFLGGDPESTVSERQGVYALARTGWHVWPIGGIPGAVGASGEAAASLAIANGTKTNPQLYGKAGNISSRIHRKYAGSNSISSYNPNGPNSGLAMISNRAYGRAMYTMHTKVRRAQNAQGVVGWNVSQKLMGPGVPEDAQAYTDTFIPQYAGSNLTQIIDCGLCGIGFTGAAVGGGGTENVVFHDLTIDVHLDCDEDCPPFTSRPAFDSVKLNILERKVEVVGTPPPEILAEGVRYQIFIQGEDEPLHDTGWVTWSEEGWTTPSLPLDEPCFILRYLWRDECDYVYPVTRQIVFPVNVC